MLRELVEKLKQQSGGGKAAGGAGAGPSGEQGAAGAAGGPAEAVEARAPPRFLTRIRDVGRPGFSLLSPTLRLGDVRFVVLAPGQVAKRVLQLGEKEDYEGILSVLGEKVDSASSTGAHAAQLIRTEDPHTAQEAQSASGSTDARRPVPGALPRAAVLRKQYLRISAMIHPDKLGRRFEGATKAFQARRRLGSRSLHVANACTLTLIAPASAGARLGLREALPAGPLPTGAGGGGGAQGREEAGGWGEAASDRAQQRELLPDCGPLPALPGGVGHAAERAAELRLQLPHAGAGPEKALPRKRVLELRDVRLCPPDDVAAATLARVHAGIQAVLLRHVSALLRLRHRYPRVPPLQAGVPISPQRLPPPDQARLADSASCTPAVYFPHLPA